eukprot:scaffold37559_cov49-Prasinocladus_malaysianus.AAC.1
MYGIGRLGRFGYTTGQSESRKLSRQLGSKFEHEKQSPIQRALSKAASTLPTACWQPPNADGDVNAEAAAGQDDEVLDQMPAALPGNGNESLARMPLPASLNLPSMSTYEPFKRPDRISEATESDSIQQSPFVSTSLGNSRPLPPGDHYFPFTESLAEWKSGGLALKAPPHQSTLAENSSPQNQGVSAPFDPISSRRASPLLPPITDPIATMPPTGSMPRSESGGETGESHNTAQLTASSSDRRLTSSRPTTQLLVSSLSAGRSRLSGNSTTRLPSPPGISKTSSTGRLSVTQRRHTVAFQSSLAKSLVGEQRSCFAVVSAHAP